MADRQKFKYLLCNHLYQPLLFKHIESSAVFFFFHFRSNTFHIFKFRQNCTSVSFLSYIYSASTTIYIRSLPLNVQYAFKIRPVRCRLEFWYILCIFIVVCGSDTHIQYAFVGTFGVWKTCVYSKSIFRIEYSVYCCLALAAAAAMYIRTTRTGTTLTGYLFCIARKSFSRVTYILKHFSYILCITRDQHATHPLLNSLSLMHVFIILNIIRASCSFRPFRACARNIFNRLTSCIWWRYVYHALLLNRLGRL